MFCLILIIKLSWQKIIRIGVIGINKLKTPKKKHTNL